MTLVIPLNQLKKWESNEEINCTTTADEYFHNQTKSIKTTTETPQKRSSITLEESPSKKHASILSTEINYYPPGVTPLDINNATSREDFFEKWSASSYIALGCLHTNGISNFRGLGVKIRKNHRTITENSKLVGFGFYLDTGELYFLSTQNLQQSNRSSVMQIIAPILESSICKICFDLQFFLDSLFSALWAVDSIQSIDDPKLIAWVA